MPYHLGCYDTEKGEHDIDVTSPVECLIHCKVIWLLIISLPFISYIYNIKFGRKMKKGWHFYLVEKYALAEMNSILFKSKTLQMVT